jgi:hypothetical protein
VEIRVRTVALCSMGAMAFLAGAYVYQDVVLPVADAFGVSAGAGLAGAVFGWSLIGELGSARRGTAQRMPVPRPRQHTTAVAHP